MAPGTNVGAAHPVDAQGGDIKGASNEKATNDVAAFARSLAETRGRNPELAAAIVEKSKSLTAQEALKEKFIDHLVQTRDELSLRLNGSKIKTKSGEVVLSLPPESSVVEVQMTFAQKLLNLISHPNVAAILMSLGMLLIYVEVSNPGITIAGVLGGISLVLAFMAFQVLPIRTGAVALMVLALVMFIGELFVASHGTLGVGGALAFCLGLIWLVDPSQTDLALSNSVLFPIMIVFLTVTGLLTYAAISSKRKGRDALALIGGGRISGLAGYVGQVNLVDETGLHGKAVFRGEVWDFVSNEPVALSEQVVAEELKGYKVKIQKLRKD